MAQCGIRSHISEADHGIHRNWGAVASRNSCRTADHKFDVIRLVNVNQILSRRLHAVLQKQYGEE
jgi:hypothetical protein